MNKFSVGCFYSNGTPYERIYRDYLQPSCDKFNINTHVFSAPNYHNWYKNVAEKPRIIGEMLDLLMKPGECLVFLDADATIEQYPTLFETIPKEYDIAYHTLSWRQWYGYEKETKELLTGTMFFRNRKKIRDLCMEWYNEAQKTHEWEQKVLQRVIKNHDLKAYPLPLEYCYMTSRPRDKEPLVKLDPVILHHQLSRTWKRKPL
jgi:hypothetical protein